MAEWMLGIASAVALAVLAWAFSPLRNRLEAPRLRLSGDHGVRLKVYVDPEDMAGLDLKTNLGIEARYLAGVNFFFPSEDPPARPPIPGEEQWWQWAKRLGGEDVYASHVLLLLQATQDRAVAVGVPKVDRRVDPEPTGIVCGPEGQGGNGLLVRRFYIDLDEPDPVRPRFIDQDGVEGPRFTLSKGETVALVAIAVATRGRHEWTVRLPITADGEDFMLVADNGGTPFVTVGRGELPFAMAIPSDMTHLDDGTGWLRQ